MRKVKVVGYRKSNGKKGVNAQLFVTYPLDSRDNDIESAGVVAEMYFVPERLHDKFSASDIGKEITLVTAFYNKQNNLIDVVR